MLVGTKHAPGRLEATEGGTLFLSGIDQLSPALQIELARFVQDRTLRTAEGERTVDVRIIAASDRDLAPQVMAHQFREDLFYDLNIISLRLPAFTGASHRHSSFGAKYAGRRRDS